MNVVFPAMVGVHSIIGIDEALIATIVVSVVIQTRLDLVDFYESSKSEDSRGGADEQDIGRKSLPPRTRAGINPTALGVLKLF
ncbi:MAG: hypothetical protein PHO53_06640 [Actinomycetota bacterium]|nr:hypothetical protein [Actinomycetota bacterium]